MLSGIVMDISLHSQYFVQIYIRASILCQHRRMDMCSVDDNEFRIILYEFQVVATIKLQHVVLKLYHKKMITLNVC